MQNLTGFKRLMDVPAGTFGTLAALLITAAALSACHRSDAGPPPPATVVVFAVHTPAPGQGGDSVRYPVEAAARYSNVMSFRVAGQLIERRVRLGDQVRQGEVLARLDALDASKQAASARAALVAAESRLKFSQQQLDRDQAQSAQALIAQNQLEQTQDAYSAALAARDQAADQVVLAENTLRYNTLVAEHNGYITSENADTGQVVSAGQAVYGLAWSDQIDVILDAAAADLARLKVGQPASVTFTALPGRRFEAHARELSPAADPQSRTYRVKLTLTDPGPEVRLGMTGEATLAPPAPGSAAADAAAAPTVFVIPGTALFHQGKDAAVWSIRAADSTAGDSTLELRAVNVRSYSDRTATIDSGLRAGDSIVAAGVHTVYAGEHVKPVKPLFADADASGDSAAPTAARVQP